MKQYIVELQGGCWLAPWKGDPGRTLVRDSAKRYTSPKAAGQALRAAQKIRKFPYARVQEV